MTRVAARVALAGGVLALCALPAILSSGAASATTLDGTATITNQTLGPLASGASTTQFSISLPANAACSGDTASGGYHVYSYLVPQGTNVGTISFTSHPSTGYGLVNDVGVYYGSKNTAITTGQIISIPTNFEWGPLLSDGATLSSLLYTGGTSGVWEAGLACASSSGTLSDYWNTEVTFTASGSDPNGFVWNAVPGGPTLPQVAPTTASLTTSGSSTFTDDLAVADSNGTVTYTVTHPSSFLSVSAGGAITTTGTLATGNYTVSGTDADGGRDSGTWTFTLTVSPSSLVQGAPTSASVTNTGLSTFGAQLEVTSSNGTVSYAVTTPVSGVSVSSAGAITVTATLPGGNYIVSGTDADSDGDSGTWSFTLTVTGAPFTFTSATTATATVGVPFTFPVTTAGSPAPKIKSTGKLPKGVKFNKGTDVLAGTPTSTKHKSAAGSYPLTFTATFGKGKAKQVRTQGFTLVVQP